MDFIIITGAQAVGKMAVGLEIEKKTELRLFHNHMTIEPVIRLFDYGTNEAQYLIRKFRSEIFETMATSNNPGMIFTFVWAFDMETDNNYITDLINLFESNDARVIIVELVASVEERLKRNVTPLRLGEKKSKRNTEWSSQELVQSFEKYRLISNEGEIKHPNYLRINTESTTAKETADIIINHFNI